MMSGIIVRHPPNRLVSVDHVWAWVSIDRETGREGLCASETDDGMILPMVTADPQTLANMTVWAQEIADRCPDHIIRLVEFTQRTDVRDLMPKPKPGPRT
jgi:hypothetical protein